MIWTLAQIDPDSQAGQWLMLISGIMLLGALAILVLVLMGVGRRWKRRQLKAIDEDRAARRAGQSAGRVDAWQASAERYVDHDKLPAEDEQLERNEGLPPDYEDTSSDDDADGIRSPDEEDRDPYGLFEDKPYQDSDDEDDVDEEEDEDDDWGEDKEPPR
ncbi:MAG: hypothetical protein AAF085_00250 [Planctomycetota bacterium]